MRQRLRSHLTYANVMVTILAFVVLGGGVAYAANTVFSSDIVNNQVYSADVRNDSLAGGGLAAADLRPGSVGPSEATGLTGADIANAASGSDYVNANLLDGLNSSALVQGRGRLLSNRIVLFPGASFKPLLEIPGLGEVQAGCDSSAAVIRWRNTTTSTIDSWAAWSDGQGSDGLQAPNNDIILATSNDLQDFSATLSLGLGNDPGPRRIVTLDAFAFQGGDNQPCGFQVQGTLWTSG